MKYLNVLMFPLVLSFAALAQVVDTNSQHFYLFTYFINTNDQAGARIAVSSDGVKWQKINNEESIFAPTISNEHRARDPYTYYDARTGVFHLVWTTGWTQKSIGYAAVKDLRDWSNCVQKALPVGVKIPECACTWAPEILFDAVKDSFMIYWSTERGTNGKRSYYCMTKDFKTISDPVLFFDPGYSVIDNDILKVDDTTYYMFFKDERDPFTAGKSSKNIHYVYGSKPQGPWNQGLEDNVSPPITSPYCEGPSAIKIGNEYRVYYDPYSDFTLTTRMVKVTDLATTASPWPQGDVLTTASGNFLFSHGHIIEIPRVKLMEILYNKDDPTTTYEPWELPEVLTADDYPLGKRNTGCGTGIGLALFPPLFFKAMSLRRRKKKLAKGD